MIRQFKAGLQCGVKVLTHGIEAKIRTTSSPSNTAENERKRCHYMPYITPSLFTDSDTLTLSSGGIFLGPQFGSKPGTCKRNAVVKFINVISNT